MAFFFNDTATTEIYTLSLHDALPIYEEEKRVLKVDNNVKEVVKLIFSLAHEGKSDLNIARRLTEIYTTPTQYRDRKSTRLNSSHANISYAVFCLQKNIIIAFPHQVTL